MPLASAWNMYIFRDGKNVYRGTELVRELRSGFEQFERAGPPSQREELIDLLLRAGELECAMRDADAPQAETAESITEAVADALVRGLKLDSRALLGVLERLVPPAVARLSPPEGFAYYALHPLDISDLARTTAVEGRLTAVIGIRSIGTTLSAVVSASLKSGNNLAERITVRPQGHPYDRETQFSQQQLNWLRKMLARQADFVVIDEGPGMSGSSFLSVGDALLQAGVPRESILFLGSRYADPDSLTARNAGERWRMFKFYPTGVSNYLPGGVKDYLGGGIWRGRAFNAESAWPASWTQMERMKFLSEDGSRLFKFEGLGRFGLVVNERAIKIGEAGFGPMPLPREEGFGVHPFVSGRYLSRTDAPQALRRMAEYCAWRSRNMTAAVDSHCDLQTMMTFNIGEEFGLELPRDLQLEIGRPVIADGRMLPHKWIARNGDLWKVDASIHGDDHFFPGPTDIAWDLAGAIVEWDLHDDAAELMLRCYAKEAGETAGHRLAPYLIAYSVFRMAYCKMAAAAMRGTYEEGRLDAAYQRYRQQANRFTQQVVSTDARCDVAR